MVDDETRDPMLDQQLRDEVMTLYLAGHETTSHALTWTFFYSLAILVSMRSSGMKRALFSQGAFSFERLGELQKTEAILRESMRIFPPVWGFSRSQRLRTSSMVLRFPRGRWSLSRRGSYIETLISIPTQKASSQSALPEN